MPDCNCHSKFCPSHPAGPPSRLINDHARESELKDEIKKWKTLALESAKDVISDDPHQQPCVWAWCEERGYCNYAVAMKILEEHNV